MAGLPAVANVCGKAYLCDAHHFLIIPMNGQDFKVGIVGAGWIAEKAAVTLNGQDGFRPFAIASRSLGKAQAFAEKWGVERAYGSYSALVDDPDVDLIYVATPHSHHFDITKEALEKGKPCLVEKAFMANLAQSEAIVNLAREKKVFLAEAIWTRYQPAVEIVRSIIREGRIGRPRLITATLAYSMEGKERIQRPDLCGGSLLDLGVYALNFVRMFCDEPILSMNSQCVKTETGVDLTNAISIVLGGGILANVQTSAACVGDNTGVIAGTEGNLVIDNINNPQRITVNGPDRVFVEEISVPKQITGYEYQFVACRDSIAEGLLEPPQMPWKEILYIMELMDGLRKEWGVRYPMDYFEWK